MSKLKQIILLLLVPSIFVASCSTTKNALPSKQKHLEYLNDKIYDLEGAIHFNDGRSISAINIQIEQDTTRWTKYDFLEATSYSNQRIDKIVFTQKNSFPNFGQIMGLGLITGGIIISQTQKQSSYEFPLTEIYASMTSTVFALITIVAGGLSFLLSSSPNRKWVIKYK